MDAEMKKYLDTLRGLFVGKTVVGIEVISDGAAIRWTFTDGLFFDTLHRWLDTGTAVN
jgi:hypothetical protein